MYIKILAQEVYQGLVSPLVGEELAGILQKHGLKITAEQNLGDILEYTKIGEYFYYLVRASDMKNRCRNIIISEEEKQDIADYITKMEFETVEELPIQEII